MLIRRYRASDKDAVVSLYSDGILEHYRPAFYNAMSEPLYLGITLAMSGAGYLLGGGSLLWALVLGGCWVGLVFYCCYEAYAGYLRERLRTDMQDIPGNYLSQPDRCFWVAEGDVMGRARVLGTVAVVGVAAGAERHGALCRMVISSSCRRTRLGSRMAWTAVDFCKERGFSKVVFETSSTRTAVLTMSRKTGFVVVAHTPTRTLTHTNTHADWMLKLSRITFLRMEKLIQD